MRKYNTSTIVVVIMLAAVLFQLPAFGAYNSGQGSGYIQDTRVQTDISGNFTWTYPQAYPTSTIPIIEAVVESSDGTIPYNVQIIGIPSSTSTTFKVLRAPTTSVLSIIVLGQPVGVQAYLDLMAIQP